MQGNIRWKDGAWRLRVDAGRDSTGKRIVQHRTVREPNTRDGRRRAETELARLVLAAESKRNIPTTSPTVEEWITSWYARASPGWAPSTRATRPGIIRKHIVAHLGDRRLGELRRRDIAAWHQLLAAGGLAAPSVRGAHRILHRALADAVELEVLDRNPATGVRVAGADETDVRPPTDDELDAVLAAMAEDPQTLTIVQLDSVLGARRGELVALRWPDIDFDDGTVTVARAISDGRSEGLVEQHTKTRKVRAVGLDDITMGALRAHRARRLEQCMAVGVRMDEQGFVFVPDKDPTGRSPIHPTLLSRRFAAACKRADVEGVRLQDVRHYVASWLLKGGLDVRTAAGWMGHSPTMLLNRYGHFIPPENRTAAEQLAARRRRSS